MSETNWEEVARERANAAGIVFDEDQFPAVVKGLERTLTALAGYRALLRSWDEPSITFDPRIERQP